MNQHQKLADIIAKAAQKNIEDNTKGMAAAKADLIAAINIFCASVEEDIMQAMVARMMGQAPPAKSSTLTDGLLDKLSKLCSYAIYPANSVANGAVPSVIYKVDPAIQNGSAIHEKPVAVIGDASAIAKLASTLDVKFDKPKVEPAVEHFAPKPTATELIKKADEEGPSEAEELFPKLWRKTGTIYLVGSQSLKQIAKQLERQGWDDVEAVETHKYGEADFIRLCDKFNRTAQTRFVLFAHKTVNYQMSTDINRVCKAAGVPIANIPVINLASALRAMNSFEAGQPSYSGE